MSPALVNGLVQTEDVGLLIHAIPLVNLRTVSISGCRTRLGSTRRFDTGRLHGRFHHVSAPSTRNSSHVLHVMVVAQGETKCVLRLWLERSS